MSKSLPSVTSQLPRDLRTFIDRMRDIVTGNGTNRLVSVDELVNAGVVTADSRGSITASNEVAVFGPPPAPTNVVASPAIRNVVVTWDAPDYPTHAYAEVWGASTDDISTAMLLGQSPGAVYVDALGPSATRYYWVRFVNVQYTRGAYNAINGTSATTGPDLTYTMGILADAYGSTSEAPFFQLDTPQEINGVVIPAGTYIKSAFIYDGVISNAMIGNAAIDDAKIANIDAGKITTGYISADRVSAGSIDATILAVDAAVIASGYIDAARINTASIGNAEIDAAKITTGTIDNARVGNLESLSYVAGSDGWKLDKNGNIELNDAVFRGTLDINSGVASGARLVITNTQIRVYDASGVLRVKIGEL